MSWLWFLVAFVAVFWCLYGLHVITIALVEWWFGPDDDDIEVPWGKERL